MNNYIDSKSRDQGMMAVGIGLIVLGFIWFLSLERIVNIQPTGLAVARIDSYTSTTGKYPQVILNLQVSKDSNLFNTQVYISAKEFIKKQEELKLQTGMDVLVELNTYTLSNKKVICIDSLREVNSVESIIFNTEPRRLNLLGIKKMIDCSELKL